TLPTGLTATAMSGNGWACNSTLPASGPATLTCTRSTVLNGGSSYPTITLTVNVGSDAAPSVTNSATVSGGGDTNTNNNKADDSTTIVRPDLTITKTHTGNFTAGQTGATYTITVTNSGGAPTSGTITMTDTLPTGLTATNINPPGNWSCTPPAGPCTRTTPPLAAGGSSIFTLTVNVASNAPPTVTNTATVSGGGETDATNDTANDPTTVIGGTAATTTTVSSSANPSIYGQSVTFTATVAPASGTTPPTGSVQFVVDGSNFGSSVSLSGCIPSPHSCATSASISTLTASGSPHAVQAFYTHTGSF